jgi:acetolactate synthase I/II/III large subunit
VQLGDYDIAHYAAAFGAKGIRVSGIAEFEVALKQSLIEPGITIIDVQVDYSRNTELFAELHDDVVE